MRMNNIVVCIDLFLDKYIKEPLVINSKNVRNKAKEDELETWYVIKINDNSTGYVRELRIPIHDISKEKLSYNKIVELLHSYLQDFLFENSSEETIREDFPMYL